MATHRNYGPVGVGRLMYVGDAEEACCYNRFAATMTKVGLGVAAYGLLAGKKEIRNAGIGAAVLFFLAI